MIILQDEMRTKLNNNIIATEMSKYSTFWSHKITLKYTIVGTDNFTSTTLEYTNITIRDTDFKILLKEYFS